MARVNTYLNFDRNTEEVFEFYKSVFKTEYAGPIMRFGDGPGDSGGCGDGPSPSAEDKNLIMHIALPILGGHLLMGTDSPGSMGFKLTQGNNVHLSLEPDTRAEAERLFNELSKDGSVRMPLADMFWGGYFGSFTDQFGIHWMVNCMSRE